MKFFEIVKIKKIYFFQIFLTLYIGINLIGGERGLISYFEKNSYENQLSSRYAQLKKELNWSPLISFEEGIKGTINWYLNQGN